MMSVVVLHLRTSSWKPVNRAAYGSPGSSTKASGRRGTGSVSGTHLVSYINHAASEALSPMPPKTPVNASPTPPCMLEPDTWSKKDSTLSTMTGRRAEARYRLCSEAPPPPSRQ
ncbi:uncharacterized protein B0H18DRAFT_982840 [Fomitopsis serialis]|uniref:uncharacterized protein n=1 Tax=Fomitopsis serialis TaxID=139415 RepID=UPI002008DB15|nr:uncharacterized protein B0H18DRAFT_982840 [Neoantrodia serialis]KAH9933935.1 hypothetical protein B0H18DRAFT_982840 [Neoantrodia serialis]